MILLARCGYKKVSGYIHYLVIPIILSCSIPTQFQTHLQKSDALAAQGSPNGKSSIEQEVKHKINYAMHFARVWPDLTYLQNHNKKFNCDSNWTKQSTIPATNTTSKTFPAI